MRNLAVAERLGERQALDRSYCCFYHKRTHARTGRYFVCSCCCRRSIARAICSCSSAIFVKPCSRKRFALARCHFADFSSPGFSGLSAVDIGCFLHTAGRENFNAHLRDELLNGEIFYTLRRVASCATLTDSAGHAGATENLTFHLDHSAGAISLGHGSGRPR